jgi:hypothetical protein
VHLPGAVLVPFDRPKRLWLRNLKDVDLFIGKKLFRNTVTGLDQGGFPGIEGRLAARHGMYKIPQVTGVDAGVTALVDDLEDIIPPDDGECHMQPTRTPSSGDRHLRRGIWTLIAGDGNGF